MKHDAKKKNHSHNNAERYVFNKLKKNGENPKWTKTGKGYDIETTSRFIEIKGKEQFRVPGWVGFSGNFLKLGKGVNKFWIYIVFGIGMKNKWKKVVKIPPQEILNNLEPRIRYGIKGTLIRRIAKKHGIQIKIKKE